MVAFKLRCFTRHPRVRPGSSQGQSDSPVLRGRRPPMSVIFDPHVGTGGKQHVHDVAVPHIARHISAVLPLASRVHVAPAAISTRTILVRPYRLADMSAV